MASNPLPSPPSFPFVGHLFELDGQTPLQSLTQLCAKHGPIFRLSVLGQSTIVVSAQKYVNELCDESRFGKHVHSALVSLRPAVGDGLFTAYGDEPNWALAHRILMPAFGPLGIRDMVGKMLDIAHQMFDRWERFGQDAEIDVADAMTRLTLDTLALCAFDVRFNSFYREDMHPFIDAMVDTLLEASARDRRPEFVTRAMLGKRRQFERDIAVMHDMADALMATRRKEGRVGQRGDLLDSMLTGIDPVTGGRLADENIRHQLVTFLIAGHETTSGLLSFATHLLLENPDILEKAQQLVDSVLGDRDPNLDDLADLKFIEQILMESLRLWPTAPAFAVTPHAPTMLAGLYPLKPGDELLILLPALHRDPAIWGEDAALFRPERFADGMAERLPPNSWKPFGNGQRACIGRGFAMQEALLVLSMMLQRFDISRADPNYRLKVAETLTMKPEGLRIRARRRQPPGIVPVLRTPSETSTAAQARQYLGADGTDTPLLILYGSNSGSSLAFARQIVTDSAARGYRPRLAAMDEAVADLPKDGAVVIVTASYEGLPPDNARQFVAWLDQLEPGMLTGGRFAVLGCGNRQWARTYQAIPSRVDDALERAGASRLVERGVADAAGNFVEAAEAWMAGLWPALAEAFGGGECLRSLEPTIEMLPPLRGRSLGGFRPGKCLRNVSLTQEGMLEAASDKRHFEIALPPGLSYQPGDHLSVLASNPVETVNRALHRLGLDPDMRVVVRDDAGLTLPLPASEAVSVRELLSDFVELEQPATMPQLRLFAQSTQCPPERARAQAMLDPAVFEREVTECRLGTLSLLESLPSCSVDLAALLAVLPPMAPRRYSIASSPLADAGRCALTVSIVDAPARSGKGRHLGVASNFLARLEDGAQLAVALHPGPRHFRLPEDPATPIIMIAAGSGIAPFRGFVEERALRRGAGETTGPALLFFGCRHPDKDWLYRDEFAAWQADSVVDVRPAFSRAPQDGHRYVQDRLVSDAADIATLIGRGAHIYVCGDAMTLVPEVERLIVEIAGRALDRDPEQAYRLLVDEGRYAVDAFA